MIITIKKDGSLIVDGESNTVIDHCDNLHSIKIQDARAVKTGNHEIYGFVVYGKIEKPDN